MKEALLLCLLPVVVFAQSVDPSQVCFKAAYDDPHIKILEQHVGSLGNANQATLAMLASKDEPTEQEKVALELWVAIRKTCTHQGIAFRNSVSSKWEAIMEEVQQNLIDITARLYAGDSTYGQFDMQRGQIETEAVRALSSLSEQLKSQRQQQVAADQQRQAQAEANRRAAILQILANRPPPIQLAAPLILSHQTYCNSVMVGSTVQTVCH